MSILPNFVKCSFGSIRINSEASAATGKGASDLQNFAHFDNDLLLMRLVWEELSRNGLLFGGAFPRGVLLGGASLGGAKEVCMLSGATAIRTPSGPTL